MKKLLLFFMMFTLTFVFANTASVNASPNTVYFNSMNSGVKEYTDEYGTSTNSRFRVIFYAMSTTPGSQDTCTTTSNTELRVKARSVAGATGSTRYLTLDPNEDEAIGYNGFYYGDEDVYYEVTLLNVNGDCKVTIIIDPDY